MINALTKKASNRVRGSEDVRFNRGELTPLFFYTIFNVISLGC